MGRNAGVILQVILPWAAILLGALFVWIIGARLPWRSTFADAVLLVLFLAPPLVLLGAGLFAFTAWKRRPRAAETTSYFIGATLSGLVVLAATQRFGDPASPRVVSGELTSVMLDHARRRAPDNLDVRIAGHAEAFTWYCSTQDCRDGAAIQALGARAPLSVELQVVGSRIVGLSVDGRQYLDVEHELRRNRWFAIDVGLSAALLVGLCLFLGMERLRRPPEDEHPAA